MKCPRERFGLPQSRLKAVYVEGSKSKDVAIEAIRRVTYEGVNQGDPQANDEPSAVTRRSSGEVHIN